MEKSAKEAISGLSLTTENYKEAVKILKKRFGNKQRIIAKHMDILLNIEQVSSPNNVVALRRLYDVSKQMLEPSRHWAWQPIHMVACFHQS